MRGYTDSGIIGRPSLGTGDKGKAAVEHLTQSFATHLQLLGES
jgi:creatinine amidohydrolase